MGILSREKVHECLTIQKQRGGGVRIGEIFLELGLIDETQLQVALAAKRGMEYVNIDGLDVPQEVIDKVPAQTATSYHIVPIEYNKAKNELVVVLDNVDNFRATDDLRTLMGFSVTAKMTDRDALEAALKKYYCESRSSLSCAVESSGSSTIVRTSPRTFYRTARSQLPAL
mgnify:CR=1 FL=1